MSTPPEGISPWWGWGGVGVGVVGAVGAGRRPEGAGVGVGADQGAWQSRPWNLLGPYPWQRHPGSHASLLSPRRVDVEK